MPLILVLFPFPLDVQLAPNLLEKHVSEVRERVEAHGTPLLVESEFLRLPDGVFQLDFIHPFISAYEQLGMYVVRLRPAGNTADSPTLLINCHYDSVVGSPGTRTRSAASSRRPRVSHVLCVSYSLPVFFLLSSSSTITAFS